MKEKPILMSTPMVRAILDGRKTQTRRIVKNIPSVCNSVRDSEDKTYLRGVSDNGSALWMIDSPWSIGDILWVRETWHPKRHSMPTGWKYEYRATAEEDGNPTDEPWKPSLFMPKDACRIKLRITNIRAERLQDISEEDSKAEGVYFYGWDDHHQDDYKNYLYDDKNCDDWGLKTARESYTSLWESINGKGSWDKNPWVWVITFEIYNP